jgi:alkylation response protein AidB-like acyl-CoA dehydrogenase
MATATTSRGGSWLLGSTPDPEAFTPERVTDEHRLIARTAASFATDEVLPALERLEAKDWDVARALMRRCGELGFIGVNVPEAFGGVDLDKVSSLIISEHMGRSPSFGATFGAQANLCLMPILMFGSDDQKQRYLPPLVSGEMIGAYALSEAGAGSDALSVRATARCRADGSYVLSGEKLWITNGGFADLVIVFAKVDGERFTAFIVERAFGGVSSGMEEHKMGLHGSSTTPLLLQDVPVPAANLLGEEGRGHKVAFSVLNFGRLKLGAMCSGGCRDAIGEAAGYAASRKQFGRPIAAFGAIRHKLGEMIARTYALEAVMYRTAGLIDAWTTGSGADRAEGLRAALEEYAVEASIAKVLGSEVLDYVLDQNVQVHGGNGYVADYPAERHYRDARVNRIFEGTNEINRLLIPGLLIKRALKGDLPLLAAARQLRDELLSAPALLPPQDERPLAAEARAVDALRKVAVFVAGAAMERFGPALTEEQEVTLWLADLLIDTCAADAATQRARHAAERAHPSAALHAAAARVVVQAAVLRADATAREALAAIAAGDVLRTHLAALRRLLKIVPANTVTARRQLADAAVQRRRYPFD